MRDSNLYDSVDRAQWVQAARDVLFAIGLFFGVVGILIIGAVVCGLIWMAVRL